MKYERFGDLFSFLEFADHPTACLLYTSHVGPGNRKRNAIVPCRLNALPKMIDHQCAVHRVINAKTNVNNNGNSDNGKTDTLALELAKQPCNSALAVLLF